MVYVSEFTEINQNPVKMIPRKKIIEKKVIKKEKEMKIGTIGTGVIVDRMIQAVNMTDHMSIEAVYSRSEQKACEYAKNMM